LQVRPPFPAAEQSTLKPQRSAIVPHFPEQSAGTSRAHSHVCDAPQAQFTPWVAAQVSPQSTVAPQLFVTIPHFPVQVCAIDSGVQALHWLPPQPNGQA
jgi:hypothetical protein